MKLLLLFVSFISPLFLCAQIQGEFEGDIKVTTLAGTGDRNVVADENGVLKIEMEDELSYFSIPTSSFSPTEVTSATEWSSNSFIGTKINTYDGVNTIGLTAPVYLPHGAEVTALKVCYQDLDPSLNATIILSQRNIDEPSLGAVGGQLFFLNTVDLPSNSFDFKCVVDTEVSPNAIIDNKNNAYSLEISVSWPNQLNSSFAIRNAYVEYKM